MKLNQNIVVRGNSVVLVPYESYHVPKYHEWMKSEELQTLTASQPLSLEDEYEMQKKCTFIVLDKLKYDESQDEITSMIGDTNIFLKDENGGVVGEIEIMIAEEAARGKGMGKEATLLMLRYGIENLNIRTYEAKIGISNSLSISLFTKLGFKKCSESNIFKECTLSKTVDPSWTSWLQSQTSTYVEVKK